MKSIPLTQGKVALVDDEDYPRIAAVRWTYGRTGRGDYPYAFRKAKRKTVYMHREVLNAPDGTMVDHIDGDGLNNTRANLRLCEHRENQWNRHTGAQGTSGYLGVYPNDCGSWSAKMSNRHIGSYDTPEDAAAAYDAVVRRERGEFARCNFPHPRPVPPKRKHRGPGKPTRGAAKVTPADVATIRARYADRMLTAQEIAQSYGLTKAAVYHIVHGRTWKHIGGPITRRYETRKEELA